MSDHSPPAVRVSDVLPDEFAAIAERVRTWGRWGEDDERGMGNLVDDDAVRRGVASVSTGQRVPLGVALSADGPRPA